MPNREDLERAAHVASNRLAALGIRLTGRESADELAQMQDAVERFEEAVQLRGGDLMVDEGVPGKPVQPDDPHFGLPRRQVGESVAAWLERLAQAIQAVRSHRSIESPAKESPGGAGE